jgi:hypothetical protein
MGMKASKVKATLKFRKVIPIKKPGCVNVCYRWTRHGWIVSKVRKDRPAKYVTEWKGKPPVGRKVGRKGTAKVYNEFSRITE